MSTTIGYDPDQHIGLRAADGDEWCSGCDRPVLKGIGGLLVMEGKGNLVMDVGEFVLCLRCVDRIAEVRSTAAEAT